MITNFDDRSSHRGLVYHYSLHIAAGAITTGVWASYEDCYPFLPTVAVVVSSLAVRAAVAAVVPVVAVVLRHPFDCCVFQLLCSSSSSSSSSREYDTIATFHPFTAVVEYHVPQSYVVHCPKSSLLIYLYSYYYLSFVLAVVLRLHPKSLSPSIIPSQVDCYIFIPTSIVFIPCPCHCTSAHSLFKLIVIFLFRRKLSSVPPPLIQPCISPLLPPP